MNFRATERAQRYLASLAKTPNYAIDATVGNGHDTLFLAELVGSEGKVWGFDVQEEAIENATALLEEKGLRDRVELFQANHASLLDHLPVEEIRNRIDCIMFNLGYRPGSDKQIITRPETTLQALEASQALLAPDGCLTIIVYTGHEGGEAEEEKIKEWLDQLPKDQWEVIRPPARIGSNSPPQLYIVTCVDRTQLTPDKPTSPNL